MTGRSGSIPPIVRGHSGRPQTISIVQAGPRLWQFSVLNTEGECIDYSFASRMGLVWRMARRSWRHAERDHFWSVRR